MGAAQVTGELNRRSERRRHTIAVEHAKKHQSGGPDDYDSEAARAAPARVRAATGAARATALQVGPMARHSADLADLGLRPPLRVG